ncbi:MAG: serine hydrolase [Saprospiraceae bacterium]
MSKQFSLLSLLSVLFFISLKGQTIAQHNSLGVSEKIDQYVEHIIDRHELPGVALAIIKDGKIIHQQNYGKANLEHAVPVSDKSIFRVYSLTKLFVSTGIFQLIEQNKLSLDDVISDFIPNLPTGWHDVQIQHLLTHSSGLPDMAPFNEFKDLSEAEAKERVFQQELNFAKGEKYSYNQTNYWLLQLIIEKITQQSFEDFILENQFDKASHPKQVFFSSDSRTIIKNRSTPYFCFETGELTIEHPHIGEYMHATNGMNITLDKYIAWDKKMRNNEIITAASRERMLTNFIYKNPTRGFTFGWNQQIVNGHSSYGFTGSLVTAYRVFPKDDLSIILLSNGLGNIFNIDDVVNHLASFVDEDITDPNNFIYETLLQASLKNNFDDFKKTYLSLKNNAAYKRIDFESQINDVGYMHLNLKKIDSATNILQMNTEENPTAWNVYDSYAEALEKQGNIKKALLNYSKAKELNVTNQYDYNPQLKEKIKSLKQQLESKK